MPRQKSVGGISPASSKSSGTSTTSRKSLNTIDFNKILEDPLKLYKFKQIYDKNKDKFESLLEREHGKYFGKNSSLRKQKTFESPTAQRRRHLLQQASTTSESDSTSENNEPLESWGPKKPIDQVLKDVIAYVHVTKMGEDRSKTIKLILKCMGATVKDTFTSDITHVVFKEGSFATYQKARLYKTHLVSILWVNACKKHCVKVPESLYPVCGTYKSQNEMDASVLISQLQSDLKDLVKDEKRKSGVLASNNLSKLSSMTSSSASTSNFRSPTGSLGQSPRTRSFVELPSADMTSDDSDCGVVDGHSSSHLLEKHKKMQVELRESLLEALDRSQTMTESKSLIGGSRVKSKTVNILEEIIIPSPNVSTEISTDNSTHITEDGISILLPKEHVARPETATMSSFGLGTESEASRSRKNLRSSAEAGTTMSSLRLSDPPVVMQNPPSAGKKGKKMPNDHGRSLSKFDSSPCCVGETDESSTGKRRHEDGDERRSDATPPSDDLQLPTISAKKKRLLYNPNNSVHVIVTPENIERENAQSQRAPLSRPIAADNPRSDLCSLDKSLTPASTVGRIICTRASTRKSKSVDGKQNNNILTSTNDSEEELEVFSTPVAKENRRSSLEFQVLSQSAKKRSSAKTVKGGKPSIVCTSFHRKESLNFERIVKKLGGFTTEVNVSPRTTHLVAGECKRTINMLMAIIQGCWIVKHEWLLKSDKADRWLNEEVFEMTEFSRAVQQCRLERQAFDSQYSMDIFMDCGPFFISKTTNVPYNQLVKLIRMCQGTIATIHRNARIIVGEYHKNENIWCVRENWVLDSITNNKLKAFKNYLIKPPERYRLRHNSSPCV